MRFDSNPGRCCLLAEGGAWLAQSFRTLRGSLTPKMKAEHSRRIASRELADEFNGRIPGVALPHIDHDAASTPGERKVWQEKMRQREADLKARGLLP